jgi:hypothetical protein
MKRRRYELIMPMPAKAANSSPAHSPALGSHWKYVEVKYVHEAK